MFRILEIRSEIPPKNPSRTESPNSHPAIITSTVSIAAEFSQKVRRAFFDFVTGIRMLY